MTLFEEVVSRGIPYEHHESDLYLPLTKETESMARRYDIMRKANRFIDDEGRVWFDVPFAYAPFWEKKMKKNPGKKKWISIYDVVEDIAESGYGAALILEETGEILDPYVDPNDWPTLEFGNSMGGLDRSGEYFIQIHSGQLEKEYYKQKHERI